MGYRLDGAAMDGVLQKLKKNYRVFAPTRPAARGGGVVRYGEVASLAEMVLDEQSHFSPKEVFHPIVQTMLYFTENTVAESEAEGPGIVLFARPCDINGIARLDAIFLQNGGGEDAYYARMRRRLHLFMIECTEGFENCFCVSMGANTAGGYSAALRFCGDGTVLADVPDDAFAAYFAAGETCDFAPEFIQENVKKVRLPDITPDELAQVHALPLWHDYDEQCISCGGCNTVCPTCSCFDTVDISYSETSRSGERRRVWAGCMQPEFTTMAGGHGVRGTPGQRMRFKVLHKVYDYRARFGAAHMCVGCGRCDARCPEDISFSHAINRLAGTLEGGGDE